MICDYGVPSVHSLNETGGRLEDDLTTSSSYIPMISEAARVSMTMAMPPSSTRQALGRRNSGVRARAPNPSVVNQPRLAMQAPAANHHWPEGPCVLAMEPTSSTASR